MRRNLTIAGLVLAALYTAACGTTKSSSSSASSGASPSPAACGHWANIRGDIRDGILSDSELRAKVGEVRSSASDPAVKAAATKLLGGITSNSKSSITEGYLALNKACE
jgi:hypothetical protein